MPHPYASPDVISITDRSRKVFLWEIQFSPHAGAWVRLHGELDLVDAAHLEDTLKQTLHKTRLLILDLRDLTFIDSAGGHVIERLARRARLNQRRVVVVRGPAHIHRVLALGGFADRLEIVDFNPAATEAILGYDQAGRVWGPRA